jgi:hypothetical protein
MPDDLFERGMAIKAVPGDEHVAGAGERPLSTPTSSFITEARGARLARQVSISARVI